MNNTIGKSILLAGLVFGSATARGDLVATNIFSLIEISSETEEHEQTVFSFKFTPRVTHECDLVSFECVYQQSFPWENFRGEAYIKIHEPVNFVHRRENIRFIAQLDWNASFRVPTARRLLDEMYGEKTFNRHHPVTVARIIVRGIRGGETAWEYELPAGGIFEGEALQGTGGKARPASP